MKALEKKRLAMLDAQRALESAVQDFVRCAAKESPEQVVSGPRSDILVIQHVVAEAFKMHVSMMRNGKRQAEQVAARHTAMYLCRSLTSHSLSDIGDAFGGRDHGTVINAVKTMESRMETSPTFKVRFEIIRTQVRDTLANLETPLLNGVGLIPPRR